MEMKKKYVLASVFVALLIVSVFQLGVFVADVNVEDEVHIEVHMDAYIQRADSNIIIHISHHEGVLTTIGKNWIEDQLGDTPATDPAKWISVSSNSSSPAAGWTQIYEEITTGGLARAAGTYTSTGDGEWTIEHQFTASATHTDVQLAGLNWASTGDNNLLCADTFTAVTLASGDKLTITWTITVS